MVDELIEKLRDLEKKREKRLKRLESAQKG